MTKGYATFEDAQAVVERWRADKSHREPGNLFTELSRDDWDIIADYVCSKFSDEETTIFYMYDVFRREFTKGHRCGVCGRTKAQNAAIGYDCLREC